MAGYLDDPDATAQAIDGDGWLHTGDIGRVDEFGHSSTITGRLKDMFLVGGLNTYPAEIEQTLATHHAIADGVASACPTRGSARWGWPLLCCGPASP